jgi:hypothetical protein
MTLGTKPSSIQNNSKHAVGQNYGVCVCFDERVNWQFELAFFGLALWHLMEFNLPTKCPGGRFHRRPRVNSV